MLEGAEIGVAREGWKHQQWNAQEVTDEEVCVERVWCEVSVSRENGDEDKKLLRHGD